MRDLFSQPLYPSQIPLLIMVLLLFFLLILPKEGMSQDSDPLWSAYDPNNRQTVDHNQWDRFLDQYVITGKDGISRVNYGSVTDTDQTGLTDYIRALEKIDVTALNRDQQFAYWANLYNAVTVKLILDHYPLESIKDIKPSLFAFGPWKKERMSVLGKALSLDDIEHGILRTNWSDPRVHYALNCASLGCPNLMQSAYRAATLDAQLTQAARDYINHPRGASIRNGKLYVASIYEWFKEDFGGTDQAVIDHLVLYANPDLASHLKGLSKISGDSYDWALNDTRAQMSVTGAEPS